MKRTSGREEASIAACPGWAPRVSPEVESDGLIAQGAPIARLRSTPEIHLVAPMPARVARVELAPGHRLSQIVLFFERSGDVLRHELSNANDVAGLRSLLQCAGAWPWLQRRPIGGIPDPSERPAGMVVMAIDTRPQAPDPRIALQGRETDFERGLCALARLTDGPVLVCQQRGDRLFDEDLAGGRVRAVESMLRHPQGLAGICIHAHLPAQIDAPVWDVHAEDVANIGELITTGELPTRRVVGIGGPALRQGRMLSVQFGADIRALIKPLALPGEHVALSGSPLGGHPARWLGLRDRQVALLPGVTPGRSGHWLLEALTRSGTPSPVIPSAALDQSFGGILPVMSFVRALSSGDDETLIQLGALSLLEEDTALADYVLGGEAHLSRLLRASLERIKSEYAM